MKFDLLLPAKPFEYLQKFTKAEYAACFRKYEELSCPFFDSLASEPDISARATEFVAEFEAKLPPFFRRKLAIYDTCQFLFLFAVPAALRHGSEAAALFADELINAWNARFPKNKLNKISFEEINSGFRTKIMGFDTGRN